MRPSDVAKDLRAALAKADRQYSLPGECARRMGYGLLANEVARIALELERAARRAEAYRRELRETKRKPDRARANGRGRP